MNVFDCRRQEKNMTHISETHLHFLLFERHRMYGELQLDAKRTSHMEYHINVFVIKYIL